MAVSDRPCRANRGAEKGLSIPELPQASCFSKLHILSAFPSFKKTRSAQEEKDETQKESDSCSGHAHGGGRSDRLCRGNAVRIVRADLTDRPAANGRARLRIQAPAWRLPTRKRPLQSACASRTETWTSVRSKRTAGLFLPLAETGEALGWKAESESMEEESRTRRSISLTKEDSRITVTWLVSDNTASQITWQKDGLLVPVDTALTTLHDVVYVPGGVL